MPNASIKMKTVDLLMVLSTSSSFFGVISDLESFSGVSTFD
jgi:hypothetical protein